VSTVSTVSTRISAGTCPVAVLRAPLASLLPALISFVGLTAMIVGILAMHVWMGGHGATTHHSAGTPTVGITTVSPADAHPASAAVSSVVTSAISASHTHDPSVTQLLPALTQPAGDHTDQGVLIGCGADCADEMALSMCVLALVLAGIAWLLTPTGRALTFSLLRRGPPVMRLASRPAPTPSLTRLCISRT
jgi:hypothetical protein